MKVSKNCAVAWSSSLLLMCLKVLIFRGNALIYIKGLHIFHWPTFSPPFFFPQVHVSRAEELYRPLPTSKCQASGPAGCVLEGPLDQRVEELKGRRAGQTLQAVHPNIFYPGGSCGHLSPISHQLWNRGGWINTERIQWKEACTNVKNTGLFNLE